MLYHQDLLDQCWSLHRNPQSLIWLMMVNEDDISSPVYPLISRMGETSICPSHLRPFFAQCQWGYGKRTLGEINFISKMKKEEDPTEWPGSFAARWATGCSMLVVLAASILMIATEWSDGAWNWGAKSNFMTVQKQFPRSLVQHRQRWIIHWQCVLPTAVWAA